MHPHRRRKKRPNYGVRTVEVSRGHNGFGFTISGQQPCILSCIVADSPADAAGLRAGDFLISVNGSNVSKLPHDAVVQLIGNSVGVIKMAIAENYFSDSSDEDILNGRSAHGNRQRPKYPHANKSRMQKAGRASNFSSNVIKTANNVAIDHDNLNKDYKPSPSVNNVSKDSVLLSKPVLPMSSSAHCVIINSSINNKNDINNVSAMVNPGLEQVRAIKVIRDLRTGAMFEEVTGAHMEIDCATTNQVVFLENPSDAKSISKPLAVEGRMETMDKESSVECRAIVGYLGTIEMPKQIATSSKLQTVRSCIRKMRQEKRTPCTVLMTILPSCMTLRSSSGELLAEYPAKRLNYVSCSSENDYRFLGLVTSASYPVEVNDFEGPEKRNKDSRERGYDIAISNSCHVFMIDTQIVEHQNHIKKADTFKICCTVDPVTGTCLEFPNNSEYIVNVIRIMYSLKPPNGFSAKGNLENISRLSNMGRKSCSPRGSNFVRKVNRPKFLHDSRSKVRVDNSVNPNVRMQNNEGYRNERANENLPRNLNRQEPEVGHMNGNDFVANSPQPSNHSEITTTSSNSDSGIGFHNDCQNISDRILVVDFPNPAHNNFNVNVPYVNPTFNSREGKVLPLRENNNRPVGVVGLDIDVDGQFLLNTTPVVEGFSGQGRPLNAGDPVLLGNLQSQPSLQNIFLSKKVDSDPSHSKRIEKNCVSIDELKNPSTSHGQYLYSLTDVQKHAIKNKLAVRAMPEKYNGNDKSRKGDSGKYLISTKVNTHDHSRLLMPRGLFHQRLAACRDESPHYDPVYSDGLACYEEHHYEIIYPDENNMCNENISNNKKCLNKSSKYSASEYHQRGSNIDALYSERTLEVADCEPDYYIGEGDNLNNSSIATCSYDDMSVTSSKSHDCSGKKSNFSVDDISLYSSKSHDEVAINSSKIKAKSYKLQTSVDDILIFGLKNSKPKDKAKPNPNSKNCDNDNTVFLHPSNIVKLRVKKNKKSSMFSSKSKNNAGTNNNDQAHEDIKKKCNSKESLLKYKLSPKVFGLPRPSASVEDICKSSTRREMNREVNWGHLEGTTSEPDLRDCRSNHYFRGSGGSPFGRWAGGSGRALQQRPHPARRPGSLANSEHDMYTKQQCEAEDGASLDDPSDNGPACWAVSLERLLSDPRGVHALSAFLEREFSAENIRFWTACERYARAPPAARPALAHAVHARHLAEGAPEPVNVDAHARQLAMDRLTAAPPDLFLQAQKQILNLMKFDSYPRFIKSDIHKECLLAELQGRPSPYPGDPALALGPHGSSPSPSKLKKSLSNAEDRRRKSLLPWHRKLRSKSRDRCCEDNEGEQRSQADDEEERSEVNQEKDPHGSNSSLLTGWDVARGLGSKQCGSSCSCDDHKACNNSARGGALCRVLLPHAAATSSVVAVGDGQESVRTLIDKLLRKRALNYLAYEVYLPSSNKPIDIDQTSLVLSGKEVTVEQRVVFKLDLPNRKVISVKSKPNKALGDVLRPILHKYGVGASGGLCVTLGNTMLELTQPVQVADGQRLQVALRSTPVQQTDLNKSHTKNSQDKNQSQNSLNQPVTVNGTCGAPSLDEITNRVFEELLQGKADRHSANIEEESVKSDNCSSEHSSGIFGRFLRRDDHRSKGLKIKKTIPTNLQPVQTLALANNHSSSEGGSSCCMEDGSCNGSQKPLIAKLRAGVRIQNAVGAPNAMENAEFLENLKQKQRARLKDKMNNPSSQHSVNGQDQKGKENNANGKIVTQYQVYDERVTGQAYPSNVVPVAATRVTPTILAVQITKPSPAPRLSLGQGSPTKVISNGSQQSNATVIKKVEPQDTDNYKNSINTEYSPAKSGFNTLDNTVVENNSLDVTVSANQVKGNNYLPESANNELKNGNVKYHGNLTQDYLNSSTTSGSDHFMRACDILNSSFHSTSSSCDNEPFRNRVCDPPPLPPKPKVLPIKPSNWGHNLTPSEEFPINTRMQEVSLPDVSQKEASDRNKRTVYLDQPSSSFV